MKYLHVIYRARKDGMDIRSVDVARELDLTKASVCRMVKLLAGMRMICVDPYGMIDLTEEGRRQGCITHRKLAWLRSFFADHLELDEPEATDSAYLFLSSFSDDCVDRLLEKGWAPGNPERIGPHKSVAG